ncbi:putative transmembrane protein domain-containing protein [Ditylenchus destructor]|uniref:Transmembrane protein domain-containing protein n=1 Tax=Ditylenchus destructor TaxID=166010 RepID=A0AAD4MQ46_9BILA|nr:putative transmembrane protein domain-containing protein [Ditylenchus destructor]
MSATRRPVKLTATKITNRSPKPQNPHEGNSESLLPGSLKYRVPISDGNQFYGITVSQHKPWPDLPQNQSKLFFECTLFLYSVLALFLQYLNLYKTLWWLPKSHWHYSMKFHLINPYILSCIGLALGLRVIKCFWDNITERIVCLCKGQAGWSLTGWKVLEYALFKTPLVTTVTSSFLFSFSRIFMEFRFKALFYFTYPLLIYVVLFHLRILKNMPSVYQPGGFLYELVHNFKETLDKWFSFLDEEPEPDSFGQIPSHLCSEMKPRNQEEAKFLLEDFDIRFKSCVFMGLFTAYFAILMPRAFIPERTSSGEAQFMLVDDVWITQLCLIAALTSFSLYVTYLFPIQYFDLMYRCAMHLGSWEKIKPTRYDEDGAVIYDTSREQPEQNGRVVYHSGAYYQAQCHPHWSSKTVAAEPGNADHLRFYRIARDPVSLVSYMCYFQGFLVFLQFYMLILTTDWQHIVTLVLLMFANYVLLAKIFKDRVVIGRVYNPSQEDQELVKQLQRELQANNYNST